MIFTLITIAYWFIVLYISVFLLWNMLKNDDIREQIMTVLVLIPFVLRLVGIK